jgi:adenylate cyclase
MFGLRRNWSDASRVWLRAALAALLPIVALLTGGLEGLELRTLDTQFQLRGPREPTTPIVIVSIDVDSFDELNLPWPWPRALHAQLLDTLRQGHPAAIGLDILFVEPSARGPEDDTALAEAIRQSGNVVLAAALGVVTESFFTKQTINPPLPQLRKGSAGFGIVNFSNDLDAFVRRAGLGLVHQQAELPSFGLLLHRLGVRAGIPSAPLPKRTPFIINFRGGPRTFAIVPYYRIVRGEIAPEEFRGKIVLVGATTPTLHDVFPTPFAAGGMTGVEIHANVLETLFRGLAIGRVPRWFVVLHVCAAALLAAWATNRLRPLWALALLFGVVVANAGIGLVAFVWGYVFVDQIAAPLTLVIGYVGTVVANFIREQRERQRLARFFSPDVVRKLVRDHDDLSRTRRTITVLFSDIRGFTTLCEKLSPEEVTELLREYLTEMTAVVFRHGGTIDKYIGDAIMALYNAPFDQPDHALQAVATALEFQDRVTALSDRWEAKSGFKLRSGVGVNTGEAVIGIIGSQQRFEYGAIGDTVNLGARLESLSKEFGTPIIISESTYTAVKDAFHCRPLGEVTVKGKTIPVRIYGVERHLRPERVAVTAPLTIVETVDDLRVSLSAQLGDLSVTGLRATDLPGPLTTGQAVEVEFTLPGLSAAISTAGQVVRSTDHDAGIAFVDLSSEGRELLESFLKNRG